MADEQLTPEQIAEMQKKNCIFCKIIAGEVESKKVFENDHFLAILDIRPATAGHVLFLPKEHVPILPLLSEERLIEFFVLSTKLGAAVQEAMIAQRTTLFIASGYAAGQQAPHLMLHIIPREKGDGLDMLDLEKLDKQQSDAIALSPVFMQATTQALQHRKRDDLLKIHKRTTPEKAQEEQAAPQEPAQEFETTNEALEAALNMSPDLRRLIIAQPDIVQDYLKKSPKLAKLFEGVNIRALSISLQRQEAQKPKRIAKEMNDDELFKFIDGNQGLRIWMLENPDELAQNILQNPRLQEFFKDIDIPSLAYRYKKYVERTQ